MRMVVRREHARMEVLKEHVEKSWNSKSHRLSSHLFPCCLHPHIELQEDASANSITPVDVREYVKQANQLNRLLKLYHNNDSINDLQRQRDRLEDMLAAMGLDKAGRNKESEQRSPLSLFVPMHTHDLFRIAQGHPRRLGSSRQRAAGRGTDRRDGGVPADP